MKCKQCYRYFPTPITMARHVKKHHPKTKKETVVENVPNGNYDSLCWLLDQAKQWEGSLIGNPDPVPLAEFRLGIAKAELFIAKLKES